MTNEDAEMITKYTLAQARAYAAQAEVHQIWATMTQAQRRLVISGASARLPVSKA